jgi:flagella basal body P-ring formation protein FlgA
MRGLLCFLVLGLAATHATAATLKPMATLQRPDVLLSDLFDDAGPLAARVLGPAPAPGGRITVAAPQLAAIARQFGVDWHPSSSTDRAVLERPGRLLAREALLEPLRAALRGAGAPVDFELNLPEFATPMVPQEATVQAAVDQLDYDSASGRFTASLALTAAGMNAQWLRLSGEVTELVELPVPMRRLLPGSVVQAEDLRMARVRATLVRGEVARTPAQAVGMALHRSAVAGQPLPLADLGLPVAVAKGSRVDLALQIPGLSLEAVGLALEAGAVGDHIHVLNPTSHAVVEAEVVGPGRARVMPGSLPQPVASQQAALP